MWWSAWPSSSGLNVNFSHEKFKIFNESRPDLKCKVVFACLGSYFCTLKMYVLYLTSCFKTDSEHKSFHRKKSGKTYLKIIVKVTPHTSKKTL